MACGVRWDRRSPYRTKKGKQCKKGAFKEIDKAASCVSKSGGGMIERAITKKKRSGRIVNRRCPKGYCRLKYKSCSMAY